MVEKNNITRILRDNFDLYEQTHRIAKYKVNVIKNLLRCRTSEMGGNIKTCPNSKCSNNDYYAHYNSCRNRSCPKCSFGYRHDWLKRQQKKLLDCGHYHVVFTLPSQLNDLYNQYPKVMANILFESTNETLDGFLQNSKYLGATTGRIVTLHTWGSNLTLHPHTHALISEGGLNKKGKWINRNGKYLFPIKTVSRIFRISFIKKLRQEIYKGNIKTDNFTHKQELLSMLESLFKVKWNVNIQDKYEHGSGILKYLTQYIKGGPINPQRIISVNKKEIRFKAKDYKNTASGEKVKKVIIKLKPEDFITRFLLHIPYPRVKTIRYYGLYSPNSIKKLNHCKEVIGQTIDEEEIDLEGSNIDDTDEIDESDCCPDCGTKLIQFNYPKRESFKRILKILENRQPP